MQPNLMSHHSANKDDDLVTRARALCGVGRLAFRMGDVPGAELHLQASLRLARHSGDDLLVAQALNALGLVAILRGDFADARASFEDALAIARRTGDAIIFLDTLVNSGHIIADLEERSETLGLLNEGVKMARRIGDRRTLAMLVSNLGQLLCFEEQIEAALPLLREGLSISNEIGEIWNVLRIHWCLGHASLWHAPAQNDPVRRETSAQRALSHFDTGIRLVARLHGRWEMPYFIEGLALVAIAEGDATRGAWLFGAGEAMRERLNNAIVPAVLPQYNRFSTLARAAIGDEAYAAAHTSGRAQGRIMQVEDAVNLLPQNT